MLVSVDGTYWDHTTAECAVCIKFCWFLSVVVALANAECTFDIELLVDDKPWLSNETLYKPVGSSGSFVRCQWCNNSTTGNPNWVDITNCNEMTVICAKRVKRGVWDLQFSSFTQLQAKNYSCRGKNDTKSIKIAVLSLPVITTHPTSQLTTVSMSVTLDCEGTGRGSITYHWETSNINGGQWMNISDSNSRRLVVRNLEQSQQYRCVVSNEAGGARSNVATVDVLSEFAINNILYMYKFSRDMIIGVSWSTGHPQNFRPQSFIGKTLACINQRVGYL